MNKFLTKVTALCVGLAMVAGVGVAVGSKAVSETKADYVEEYTLNGSTTATGNAYASASTVTQNGIGWSVTANTEQSPWRVGGKGITNTDRPIYSTSAISANIAKIEVTSGATASSLTVNSLTISVHSSASDAASGSNAIASKSVSSNIASKTVTFEKTDSTSWAGKFYRIVYNVTRTGTSGNGYITFSSAKFYSSTSESADPAIALSPASLSFLSNGEAQTVTVSPNEEFTGTPTITISGTPSYVNCSVNGLTVSVSPKAAGSETVTVVATYGSEVANASLTVEVIDPLSVAEVISLIDENTSLTHPNIYVEGIVSQVDSYNSTYKSITYWISDDGSTATQFQCYSGKGIASADFSAVGDVEVGAQVVVCGTAKYYGTTHEFDKNNYLVSYTAPTSSPLSSISLSGTHATTFDVGDTFSYAGLVVTAHYEDTSSKTVTPTSVSSPDMSSAGQKTVTVTYTENEVSKNASYTITVNAVTYHTISFLPGEGSGSQASEQEKDGHSHTLPTTTTFVAPEGKVFDGWTVNGTDKVAELESVTDDVEVTALWKDAPSEVSDTLTASVIGVEGTTYTSWTDKSVSSNAVYAGNSSSPTSGATSGSIQLRSGTSSGSSIHSGIVSTTSGGTLVGVQVVWNAGCTAGRVIDVYGKATAYATADDLYSSGTQGTKLGSITQGSTTELTGFEGCAYVGIRSNSSALNIDSVTFIWEGGSQPEAVLTGITVSGAKTDFEVGDEFVTTGLVVTGHYQDATDATIALNLCEIDSSNVDTAVAGDYTITVSYGGFDDTYVVTYSEPAPVVMGTYKKVVSNLADFSGSYLLVYEGDSTHQAVAFNGSLDNLDVGQNGVAVEINDGVIELSEAYEFTIAKKTDGYSLQSKSGLYVGKTASGSGMNTKSSDDYTNSISYSFTDNEAVFTGEGGSVLKYNYAAGTTGERFRFYNSGQQAIALYVKVANAAESLALDILNETSPVCNAEHDSSSFASVWASLGTKFEALGSEKSVLVEGDADANGTFVAEALARYDLIVGRYGLEGFITDRVASSSYIPVHESSIDASNSVTVIVIVAVTSMTLLGVTLVLRKRKHQ